MISISSRATRKDIITASDHLSVGRFTHMDDAKKELCRMLYNEFQVYVPEPVHEVPEMNLQIEELPVDLLDELEAILNVE